MRAYIVLETGQVFKGKHFGCQRAVSGEVVFQTGMVGYPESLTDPSYKNQLLVLTYPLIGNYGVPPKTVDKYGLLTYHESDQIHVNGLIVSEYVNDYSHWNGSQSLDEWLKDNEVPGIYDIDTRQLTKVIREHGTVNGQIIYHEPNPNVNPKILIDNYNLVSKVSTNEMREYNKNGDLTVLVIDCGIKYNQLRILLQRNVHVKLVPWDYDFLDDEFDRIFISNGPGDPKHCSILIDRLKKFMTNNTNIPIFCICLGHQILALAAGANTYKMKYGNRGHNIPCYLDGTNKCFITSQNHGYAVDSSNLPDGWKELFINANDSSNEGIYHKSKPYYSVQFHPEACPGPRDTLFLYDIFLNNRPISDLCLSQNPCSRITTLYNKVLILGSGGLSIGQSGEFDYSGSQAIKAYKEEGLSTILINPNIATVQTSPGFADKVYFVPITEKYVTEVIRAERPDCVSLSFGGQTALNCGVELYEKGIFEEYNISILGTPIQAIINTEDRDRFKHKILEFGEKVPEGFVSTEFNDAFKKVSKIGFPVLIRSAYALGGLGSGFAHNEDELKILLKSAFAYSNQVIVDKSLKGWKEIEYEIVRDRFGNCISVCNMENVDPLGIHTGESIVVAPSQTLTDDEYNMLRTVGIELVKKFGIVGECNIQYALNPKSKEYYIIEINARLSRSSALASKATGYPLAYIAAKLSIGYSLLDLKNSITRSTTACFEPSLDYCVVKIPRWDLEKFPLVSKKIGSSMKSIGEAMGISRGFEEAFQKALRMANDSVSGFDPNLIECTDDELKNPSDKRIFAIATGFYNENYTLEKIHELTHIDKWFLYKFKRIIETRKKIQQYGGQLDTELLRTAKKLGFCDKQIAQCIKSTELVVRNMRLAADIMPVIKQIDTVAGEFPCYTNYLYTTYNGSETDVSFEHNNNTVIVLGSGVYKIGSSVEFDWCAVNCVRELRKIGKKVIVINCNPETVSTDYDEADKLYFDELSFETVMNIYQMENPLGIILSMGGQIPNNIAMALYRQNVNVIGTSPEMIDKAENRYKFSRLLDKIKVDQPVWKKLTSIHKAKQFCQKVGYPCLVRPSYVLSGIAMNVAYTNTDLEEYLDSAVAVSRDYPVVISKYITDAKEIEVDAVASNGVTKLIAISEHVENAGVHSGDATLILPPRDINEETMKKIKESTHKISKLLDIDGPFNIQFIAKDDEVKVIECNLRVSRTFPFVSKTLGVNFAEIATQIMMGLNIRIASPTTENMGVKVPQFSFNRLKGVDITLGVEMVSTGEVACFGTNHYEAYIKALISTGFKLPKNGVLLSIGSFKFKKEFHNCVKTLVDLGYTIYGTHGTADYYKEYGMPILELPVYSSNENNKNTILDYLANGDIDLVINISEKNKVRCVANVRTHGYRIRRAAVESSVPIITDIKCAKLFVSAIHYCYQNKNSLKLKANVDCITFYKTIQLPGLIDVHVHVREPGSEYKEDWDSCTKAALAGGITTICAMPNTNPPIVDAKSFELVCNLANEKACCDYAIFVGANSLNKANVSKLSGRVAGLKMYLNNTYGPLLLESTLDWMEHIKNWNSHTPICVHAESKTLPAILHIALLYDKHIHVCHVARKEEIEIIRMSKILSQKVTCEVSPHHLFLNCTEHLKCCGDVGFTPGEACSLHTVKPPLMTADDQQALWDNMNIIDCFSTDHAPHTLLDKKDNGSPGFPGLETALPLLLTAVKQNRLKLTDIVEKYYENPRKIFGLPKQENTYIEVDLDHEWVIPEKMKYSKCGWTPFAGTHVVGLVRRVVLRGEVAYVDGSITVKPGYGENLRDPKLFMQDSAEKQNIVINTDAVPVGDTTLVIKLRSILSVSQFDRNTLRCIFDTANKMRILVSEKGSCDLLKGKVMASIFYEPSTRTRCSFSVAMKRLGGDVVEITSDQSSVKKGETLEDFVRCLECYTDVLVLRSSMVGSANRADKVLKKPIINAGDGVGEHPTQALLDVFTIREEIGTVNGLTITMVGDLKHGRTVHSLAKLLSLYDVRLRYVSPRSLKLPQKIFQEISERNIEQTEHENIDDIIEQTDVLYVTRIQQERFDSENEYNKIKDAYIITPQILTKAKSSLRIMHPLPRVDEISPELDSDPRAVYFRQMEYGMYVRMALLSMILID